MRRCELCSDAAAVYCPSDSAYLCRRCDSDVHAANFLVARHLRSGLCSGCGEFSGERFSGPGVSRRARDLCGSCGRRDDVVEEEESSLSSICISTTESSAAGRTASKETSGEVSSPMRRRRERSRRRIKADVATEGVLVNWCKRLGLDGDLADVVVSTAVSAFLKLPRVPLRVALATSFWVGVRYLRKKKVATCQNLARLEKITGVPAREILAVEGKLGRVVKARGRVASEHSSYEEGWAEC
ncbi:hypothetical protein V2J09_002955 [Rumex salicifolius]